MTRIGPHEYMCIDQPYWQFVEEREGLDEFHQDGYEFPGPNVRKAHIKMAKSEESGMQAKSAAEHAEWKWVMMKDAWLRFSNVKRKTSYTNPHNFDLDYLYIDHHRYGLSEVLENQVGLTDPDGVRFAGAHRRP